MLSNLKCIQSNLNLMSSCLESKWFALAFASSSVYVEGPPVSIAKALGYPCKVGRKVEIDAMHED